MQNRRRFLTTLSIIFLFSTPLVSVAQQTNEQTPAIVTVEQAPSKSPADFLPEKLANTTATTEIKEYQPENLTEVVGDKTVTFQNYKVRLAASRNYGAAQVDIFQTESRFAAFGLFNYLIAQAGAAPAAKSIGSGSATIDKNLVFWKSEYLVKVSGTPALAVAVAEKLPTSESVAPPTLFNSLPAEAKVAHSERYFLGAQTLASYIPHASELFVFDGDAEAAFAEYHPNAKSKEAAKPHAGKDPAATLKLAIVEYHTPQFATVALNRANEFVNTLPPEEQQRIIIKRVGNFIVEAANVEDRQFAEKLMNSIEYPYVVKMLKDPNLPHTDPHHTQKAAQVILSSFGLIGLTGLIVMVCGSILGTAIFLKRRKYQRQIFSDAGGMLRLQLDPIEDAMFSLPPGKRD